MNFHELGSNFQGYGPLSKLTIVEYLCSTNLYITIMQFEQVRLYIQENIQGNT